MPSTIEGVIVTPLNIIPDERGQVMHVLRKDAPGFTQFGEAYISCVYPDVTKGWKLHSVNVGNLTVPIGRVKFVLHDLREGSPTKGKTDIVFLGDNSYQRLTIPPGIAYAWKNLLPSTAYILNCSSEVFAPGESKNLPLSDIDYTW